MTNAITKRPPAMLATDRAMGKLMDMVLDTVSPKTRRDYRRALGDFLTWYRATGQTGLNKATVAAHAAHLKAQGTPASSINQRLAAIRKLANEAADNGLIEDAAAQAIGRVENVKLLGQKTGNWLDRDQAAQMINAPDTDTLKGLRDRAILAIMLGGGLRRSEVVALTVGHLQQRGGRWVILNLTGKHNRTRTIPIAGWIKEIIDQWLRAAGHRKGALFRRMYRAGHVAPGGMTSQAVWDVVTLYAPIADLAPHDLRRTFAKLADAAGAPLTQIQKTLGHASVQTTEKYIGADQDLQQAPSDYIRLDLPKR
jgi:integrase/recombinase XerD